MIRKFLLVLLIPVLAATGLYAATWYWTSPYENVTTYRYQLDSEVGRWTYLDGSITSVTLDVPDDSVLYVQLSLDGGRSWSPSGKAMYKPESNNLMAPSASVVYDEGLELILDEDELELFFDGEEIQEDAVAEPVVVEPEEFAGPVKVSRPFDFNFGIGLGSEIIPYEGRTDANLLAAVNLDFENIASSGNVFGLDLLLSVNMYLEPAGGNLLDMFINPQPGLEWYKWNSYSKRYSADAMLGFDFLLGSTDINIALGGGMALFMTQNHPVLFTFDDYSANAYAAASFSLDKYIGSVFHIGLGYKFKYTFAKEDILKNSEMTHDVVLKLGFTF